ncbi:transposase [Rhizobium ruizarguesonis]|nr:transposase [Rhizobium ruizarguesonis]
MSDQFTDGRRLRILTVVDDCTRECLALVSDTSLSDLRVARELDRIIEERGKPRMIVSDNGSEFTSNAILQWADRTKVDWHYIAPGKPIQNAFIESFNGQPKTAGANSKLDKTWGQGQWERTTLPLVNFNIGIRQNASLFEQIANLRRALHRRCAAPGISSPLGARARR